MKRHLTYIVFGTILILGHFVFAGNLYVYASDVPYIAFSSKRQNKNHDIYMMDINGKNLQQLTDHFGTMRLIQRFHRTDSGWLMFPIGTAMMTFM